MPQANYHWGYSSCDEWTKHYPVGKHQSPINILVSNYDQLIESTCCATSNSNNNNNNNSTSNGGHKHHHKHQHHHHHHHGHVITERMASLYLTPNGNSNNNKLRVVEQQPRTHLDSVGDDLQHPRSSSTCSSNSAFSGASGSCPPSPAGNTTYDSDSDSPYASNTELLAGGHLREAQKTRYCSSTHKIFLGYPRYLNSIQLCNTGHSWQVNLPDELASHTLLSGPPFGEREYRLAQLHCHWGEDNSCGSEHLINGCSFAAEIHFVHWNCTDYSSMKEASKHKHGLAVLGVMVQALDGEQYRNKHLDKIANALRQVEKPGSQAQVHARLDLKKLFPANRWNYATYEGSLTTPPLSEVVDWLVFLNPIQCSTAQLEQFRQLRCPLEREGEMEAGDCDQQMIKNHRPVQPHNGRLVSVWTHH